MKKIYRSIKELVIDAYNSEGAMPSYEKLTALVREYFPNSKWQKTHYVWYKSQIKTGRLSIANVTKQSENTTSDIFISYKREEQAIARKLANALEGEGWSVWWDPKLRAGEHFDDVIEKALNEAKCITVLWSELSVKSRYIRDEATYALEKGKLFPVKIENVEVPFRFRGVQTLRLIGWDGSKEFSEFRRLVDDMATILGRRVQASVTDPAFYMRIEDIFSITGRGTVVTGVVEGGTCRAGQEVVILKKSVRLRRVVVLGIEKFRKLIDTAKKGDHIGMLLKDVVKEELKRGMVVSGRI